MTYITFQGNSGDSGGGLAATGAAPISMNDCYFNGNSASSTGTGRGGAMFCEFSSIQSFKRFPSPDARCFTADFLREASELPCPVLSCIMST